MGHTGTLDPFAAGLMILVIGKECRNAGMYSRLDKIYEATITVGKTSTTGDPEGEIATISSRRYVESEVKDVLARFVGHVKQTPPTL